MTKRKEFPRKNIWKDVKGLDEALKNLIEEGEAALKVAAKLSLTFGVKITKSKVVGRARRQGYELKLSPKTKSNIEQPQNRMPLPPQISEEVRAMMIRLTMPISPPRGCQWIDETDEMGHIQFCGKPTGRAKTKGEHTSWCAEHFNIVFEVKGKVAKDEANQPHADTLV